MRFLMAFLILCGANGPVGVGWALFLCLWKIGDMLEEFKPNAEQQAAMMRTEGGSFK